MSERPLSRILALQAVIVAIVPFMLVGIIGAWVFLPRLKADVSARQQELARTIVAQIDNRLESAVASIKGLAAIHMGDDVDWHSMRHVLDAEMAVTPLLNALYVVGPDGRVAFAKLRGGDSAREEELSGVDFGNSELVREVVRRRGVTWSETYLSVISGKISVAVAVPAVRKLTVIAEIDLDRLSEHLGKVSHAKEQLVLVLDRRGQVIADQAGNYTAQQLNLSNIPLVKQGLGSSEPLSDTFTFENRSLFGTIIERPANRWLVLVAQPTAAVFQPALTSMRLLATGLVVALVLGIGASLIFARRLCRKFAQIERFAQRITAGDDTDRLLFGNVSEMNRLADNLRQMAEKIVSRERQLKESESRLQLYFLRLPVATIVWNSDFRVQHWNPAAERLFGFPADEVLGKTARELFAPIAGGSGSGCDWEKLLNCNLDASGISEYIVKTGETITCSWTNTQFRDLQGEVVGVISVIEDISARRAAEMELQKLSLAVQQSPVTIVITDRQGNIEYVNPQFTLLTGYSPDEVIGRNPRILKSGQTPEAIYRHLWETIVAGRCWQGELCNRKKNGELYWESVSVSPIVNANGVISHFVAVKEDVSDRRRAADRLLLDAIRFSNLYAMSSMVAEPEERILDFALEAAVQITRSSIGYIYFLNEEETELTLHAWSNKVMEHCSMPVKPTVYRVEETGLWGEAVRQRKPVITNDYLAANPLKKGCPEGHVPIVRHMNIPLIEQDKIVIVAGVGNKNEEYTPDDVWQLTLLMSAMWKIIGEKRAESLLQESEERFRQMFAQNDDAIILVKLRQLRVMAINPAAIALFGIDGGDPADVRLKRLVSRKDIRATLTRIRTAVQHNGFIMERATGFKSNGETMSVSVKAKVIELQKEKVLLCSIRDISEKLRLEEEIKLSQAKLIQANKMTSLGMLVSGVAHEINNPNQAISMNAAIFRSMWRDALSLLQQLAVERGSVTVGGLPLWEAEQTTQKLLDGIGDGSRRINAIVANMRDYVKGGNGKGPVPFEINRICENAAAILWHQISRYCENFSQELAPDIPLAQGDAQQIEQVIINLLVNALQALPNRTYGVCLATSFDERAGQVIVTVRDEGKGMSRDVLQRLAEPFFTTREAEGGTGLGLYISKSIIKEYRGVIEFVSEPGAGTTATIRLPAAGGEPEGC